MIHAFAALLVFQFLGEVLARGLHLPLPGPLVGMLALFFALLLRGSVPAPLASTSGLLLQHMMLMFVPPVAGVMLHFERVAREWQPFLIASVVSTLAALVVTALTLQWLLRRTPVAALDAAEVGADPGPATSATPAKNTEPQP